MTPIMDLNKHEPGQFSSNLFITFSPTGPDYITPNVSQLIDVDIRLVEP